MAERRWTDEQLSAINTRDKTLLVSAAAGSGKTATLTERIIRSLTDPVFPMDIDSILVVTFTNAAASELRAKISKALTDAVEQNPEDKHLKRQLYLLPSAKIRTIDSFCNELLRANCDRVGLPPVYRIADTAECELLAISIIEGLIEAVYNGDLPEIASPEEFDRLCDCLTDTKRTE
jgi:ATP-dependent helicase/nuclease subunit A